MIQYGMVLNKKFMEWKDTAGPPHQLEDSNKLVRKAADIAKLMNEFFISKVTNIRSGLRQVASDLTRCYPIMTRKNCTLSLRQFTDEQVKKMVIIEHTRWAILYS